MRAPDLQGTAKVWRLRMSEQAREFHRQELGYRDSQLVGYLVNGPYHPLWNWWYVSVISLAPVEGAPPAHKWYPEAEYEFMILALNPEGRDGQGANYPPDVDRFEAEGAGALPGYLTPADVIMQFHGVTPEQAVEIGESAARAIAHGVSCDSDNRQWWNQAIANSVEHIRLGGHPPQ